MLSGVGIVRKTSSSKKFESPPILTSRLCILLTVKTQVARRLCPQPAKVIVRQCNYEQEN